MWHRRQIESSDAIESRQRGTLSHQHRFLRFECRPRHQKPGEETELMIQTIEKAAHPVLTYCGSCSSVLTPRMLATAESATS